MTDNILRTKHAALRNTSINKMLLWRHSTEANKEIRINTCYDIPQELRLEEDQKAKPCEQSWMDASGVTAPVAQPVKSSSNKNT